MLGPAQAQLSDAGRVNLVRAVAGSVVRTRDMHPNLVALLAEVGCHCAQY